MAKFKMFQVVTFDGVDAYVIKVIAINENDITSQLAPYGDMESLKVIEMFSLSYDNIKAYETLGDDKEKQAVARFIEYYFE